MKSRKNPGIGTVFDSCLSTSLFPDFLLGYFRLLSGQNCYSPNGNRIGLGTVATIDECNEEAIANALCGSAFEVDSANMLCGCGKAGTAKEFRLTLGCHSKGKECLADLYSRDELAEPLRQLGFVLTWDIEHRFLPDCTRSGAHIICDTTEKYSDATTHEDPFCLHCLQTAEKKYNVESPERFAHGEEATTIS